LRVLICGDAHGFGGMVAAAHLAVDLKADAIILCGDVWDIDASIFVAGPDGGNAVPPMHVVLGNHERWDRLAQGKIGDNITVHRNYTKFDLGGRSFGVLGQIDDTPVVRDLIENGLWLGETDKIFFERLEGQRVRDALGMSDVLLFHDAPWPFILGHRPLPMDPNWKGAGGIDRPEIVGSEYLNEVVRTVGPKLAFHGHLHLLDIRYIGKTRVYGLPPIDPNFEHRGYALLDTETLRVEYHDL
jgi:Icc-related predicted phosphoesterase